MGNNQSQHPVNNFSENRSSWTNNSNLDEAELLSRFEEISNNEKLIEQESQLPQFQFNSTYTIQLVNDKFIRVPASNNNFYSSDIRDNGVCICGQDSVDEWIYVGQCLRNSSVRDGIGFLVYINKIQCYKGSFCKDSMNGFGRFITTQKLIEGDWFDNQLNGEGNEYAKGQVEYQGNFQKGKYHGLGKQNYRDESCYIGEFKNGERNGYGEYWWRDGSYYQGNWKQGKFNGYGKYIDQRQNCYEGHWKNNKFEGYGEFQWSDGKKYKGNYCKDKRSGYGEFYWPDGQIWRGNWKGGVQHGKGELYSLKEKKSGYWFKGNFVSWA